MTDLFESHDDDATFETLGKALPRISPPEDMLARILAATEPNRIANPRPIELHRRRRWLPVVTAAAAAAAAVAITISLEGGSTAGTVSAIATPAPQSGSRITGQAALYRPDKPGGRVRLELHNVPTPPSGSHYELWLLPQGSRQMTATASFTPASRDVDLTLPIPAPDQYAAFEISVQPNHGSPERSRIALTSGTFIVSR